MREIGYPSTIACRALFCGDVGHLVSNIPILCIFLLKRGYLKEDRKDHLKKDFGAP